MNLFLKIYLDSLESRVTNSLFADGRATCLHAGAKDSVALLTTACARLSAVSILYGWLLSRVEGVDYNRITTSARWA